MTHTKKLVVANWKLYVDSPKAAKDLMKKTQGVARTAKRTRVVVCPAMPLLGLFAGVASRSVSLGAQDAFWDVEPKHTGQSNVYALRGIGASYVIVGHSEMRALGETNDIVARKVAVTIKAGLTATVCVGERERDQRGAYLAELETQIRESLTGVSRAKLGQLVVAYEPVWAIGKSARDAMTPDALHETTLFIKKTLVNMYGRAAGTAVSILYGGSVEAENAGALVRAGAVDGLLVGHASTDAREFSQIVKSVDTIA